MYSKFLFAVIFLMLYSQLYCQDIEFYEIISEIQLVTPTKKALDKFWENTEDLMFQYEFEDLFQNRTLQEEFFDQIGDLLRSSETTYPFVLRIPNSVILPYLKNWTDVGIQKGLQEIKDLEDQLEVTQYSLDVHVPTNGICKNSYRADLMIHAQRKYPFEWFYSGYLIPNMTLSGYICANIEVDDWILNLNTVDVDAKIDGGNLIGRVFAGILKIFDIDELLTNTVQQSFDLIDLGKVVEDEVMGNALVILENLAPALQDAQNITDEKFENKVDDIKKDFSRTFKNLVNITLEIDPENLVFILDF